MKHVLMICYYYPPITSVGSKRSVAFSKYMAQSGWVPHVLSVTNPLKEYVSIGDEKPPQGVHAEYTPSLFNPYQPVRFMHGAMSKILKFIGVKLKYNYVYAWLCFPDYFFGWILTPFLKGLSIVRRYDIDVIYVSCSPFSSAVTGVFLKMFTGRKLVVDFRDPFATGKFQSNSLPSFRLKLNRFLEKHILRYADLLIVTSEGIKSDYVAAYPEWEQKILTIYNGFDPDNLKLLRAYDKYEKFTICYTGQFYSFSNECEPYTIAFFSALRSLKERGVINSSNFRFLYYGPECAEIDSLAIEYDITDLVESHSAVSYSEIVEVIQKCHLQLLRVVPPMISTKLFEGIPMDVPFIATIPEGEVVDIIRAYSPGSYCCISATADEICDAIMDSIEKNDEESPCSNDVEQFVKHYSRKGQSEMLMKVVSEL